MLSVVDYSGNLDKTMQLFNWCDGGISSLPSDVTDNDERIIIRGSVRTWLSSESIRSIIEMIRQEKGIDMIILSNEVINFKYYSNVIQLGDLTVRKIFKKGIDKLRSSCVYIRRPSDCVYILSPPMFEVDLDNTEINEDEDVELTSSYEPSAIDWGTIILLSFCIIVIIIVCVSF